MKMKRNLHLKLFCEDGCANNKIKPSPPPTLILNFGLNILQN